MNSISSFKHQDIQGFRFGSNPFGKPRMFAHIYFVDGLLIDTGHSNMAQEIMASIGELAVEQIFITHHHEDHTGNLAAAQRHFERPTYASSQCVEMMRNPPSISLAQRLTWGDRPNNRHIVAEDRQIATSRYNFDLIPMPGHAVDMVGLYEASQGWLFSADLWVASRIRLFMRSESMKQQITSIKRALELDFDALLCGHRPQLSGGKCKLQEKLQFLEEFYGTVVMLHNRGESNREIMRQMGLKEKWQTRLLSTGELSTLNMIRAVIRDEKSHEQAT